MGGLRDSRLVVIACTLTCVIAGLVLEVGAQLPRTSVGADQVRLVRTSTAAPPSASPELPPATSTPPVTSARLPPSVGPTTAGPGPASGPPDPGDDTSPGPPGTGATTGAGGRADGPGKPTRTTGPGASTGPPAPTGCGSPRSVHGFLAAFVFPCEKFVVATYPVLSIHVSAYPADGHGAITVVQTVLSDKDGPVKERPVYAMLTDYFLSGKDNSTWSGSVQIGKPCIHDRGRTRLSIYLLTQDGVEKALRTWQQGAAIGRMPAGSELMDEVTVTRRGSCDETAPPTGPPPTDPPTTSPEPTTPSPSPSPTSPSPTGPSPTGPSPTTASPTGP
ncbi:hypothetical protein OG900_29830 [Streptomyces sp. NBC_00433]